jgi:predicted  nucleic acid-binding Zn-ribbon protein
MARPVLSLTAANVERFHPLSGKRRSDLESGELELPLLSSLHRSKRDTAVQIIIVAIAVALLLLWGGIIALLRMVDVYEPKHFLGLGAYTTLVSGLVMGLVLYNSHVRQQEQAREFTEQMTGVTRRLSDLSERLLGQLAEKANLTASEFEIRSRLQNEQAHHQRTQAELAEVSSERSDLEKAVQKERGARISYQTDQNSKIEKRFVEEDERYQRLQELLGGQRRSVQTIQKQLAGIQDNLDRLGTRTAKLESNQNKLLGNTSAMRQIQDLNAQKIDAVARSQVALYDDLNETMTQVDSLYEWRDKR